MKSSVNVRQFTHYRTFLVAHVQVMKLKNKSWSYGAWAHSLGLKDPSSVTKIIQGQRDPGPATTERLVHYFRFNEVQARYFRDLVRLEKLRHDPRLSVLLMEKMGKENPDARLRLLDDKTFSVISNWYYLAVRETLRVKSLVQDPEVISKKFQFKVTPREVGQAIKTMLEVGLLTRDELGNLSLTEGRLDTTQDIASEAIKRYHEQMLTHAHAAVRSVPVKEREITATTLVMQSSNLGKAKELIREFKERFERLLEEDVGDKVYQLQIQLFPLTSSLTNPEGSAL